MEDAALFLHLLGAFLLVAGTAVAGAAFEAARRRTPPADVALLLGVTRVGVALVGIGTLLAAAFGLWLVDLGDWGYGSGWVDAAIALFLVTLAVGGLAGQRPKRARLLARRCAEAGEGTTPELRALLDDPLSRLANYVSALLLVAIVALMVFKPGAVHG